MINDPLAEFIVDKTKQTVSFKRQFDAERDLVWDAFTKQEILDQWWAPKPFLSRTKVMDFEVGGRRFYAMVSPEGAERWAVQRYTSITPKTNFQIYNAFADEDENPELPGSEWNLDFIDMGSVTEVRITIYNESLARLEKMLEFGFREGTTMTMKALEELLATLSKR